MRKRLTGLVIAIVLFAPVASAQNPNVNNYDVFGVGTRSCGNWTLGQKESPQQFIDAAWLTGYVTGVGMTLTDVTTNNSLRTTDVQGLLTWMNTYCAANPLVDIAGAAYRLVIELQVVDPALSTPITKGKPA